MRSKLIVFFQNESTTLALCPRDGMAQDISQENPPQGEGFGGITLAYVAREQDEVDRIMELAEKAGERSSRNLSACSGEATAAILPIPMVMGGSLLGELAV